MRSGRLHLIGKAMTLLISVWSRKKSPKSNRFIVTYNDKGEVEGVKFDRIGVLLINAVKEQQAQIEAQKQQNESLERKLDQQNEIIKRQQAQIEAMKSFICSQNPAADFCKPKN